MSLSDEHLLLEEQPTMRVPRIKPPLPLPRVKVNTDFDAYMQRHHLDWQTIADASAVRPLTVWSIHHDQPVTPLHAAQVRQGVALLTGEVYSGPIILQERSA